MVRFVALTLNVSLMVNNYNLYDSYIVHKLQKYYIKEDTKPYRVYL